MNQGENRSRRRFLGGVIAVTGLIAAGTSRADSEMGPSKNKLVYQVNKSDPDYLQEILHSAAVILQQYNNDVDVALTCFGPGIWLLVKDAHSKHHYKPFIHEQVSSLAMYGVSMHACQQTMKAEKIQAADLVSDAKQVSSGAADLLRLQQQGYAYIAW